MTSSKVKAYLACLCIPNNTPGAGKYSGVIRKKRQEYLAGPGWASTFGDQPGVVAGRAAGMTGPSRKTTAMPRWPFLARTQ